MINFQSHDAGTVGWTQRSIGDLDERVTALAEVPADKQTAKTLADLEKRLAKLEAAPKVEAAKVEAPKASEAAKTS